MKKFILAGCILSVVVIFSCGKKGATSASLNGQWELREIQGGMIMADSGPDIKPGNGNGYKFSENNYEVLETGKLISKGTFDITRDTSMATGRLTDAIIIKDETNEKIYYEINKDTLILYRGIIAADGTIAKYVKLEGERK